MMDVCFHSASSPTGYSLTGSASGEISEEGGGATEVAPGRDRLKRKLEQCVGVHAGAIEFDTPVQMRACGTAGGSHLADDLPACMRSPSFTRTSERWKYIL